MPVYRGTLHIQAYELYSFSLCGLSLDICGGPFLMLFLLFRIPSLYGKLLFHHLALCHLFLEVLSLRHF